MTARTLPRLVSGFGPHRFMDRRAAVAVFLVLNAVLGLGLWGWFQPVPSVSELVLVRDGQTHVLTAHEQADWPSLTDSGLVAYQSVPSRGRTPLDGARIRIARLQATRLSDATDVGEGYRPLWSQDGAWLAFWRHGRGIWAYRVATRETRLVSRQAIDAGYLSRPAAVPLGSPAAWQGHRLIFSVRIGALFGVASADLDTAVPATTLVLLEPDRWPSGLQATTDAFAYTIRHRFDTPIRVGVVPPATPCAVSLAPPRGLVYGSVTCSSAGIIVTRQTPWTMS